jgi:hypothetical protein
MTRLLFRSAGLFLLGSAVLAGTLDELSRGVGEGRDSIMRTKFEVTFMKIDVADIEVRLTSRTAAGLAKHLEGEKPSDDVIAAIAEEVLEADTLMIRMNYLRDGDFDKLRRGFQRNLEDALKSDSIDEPEFETMWTELQQELSPLEGRGVKKGEDLVFRVEGTAMWIVILAVEGETLLSIARNGSEWARGVKGSFLGRESRFHKGLVRSLFEDRD